MQDYARPSKAAGICQAIGVGLAFVVAETCWLHWETVDGESSWSAAIRLWPLFLREYTVSALIGAGCAAYGAWSAYDYAAGTDARRTEPANPNSPSP